MVIHGASRWKTFTARAAERAGGPLRYVPPDRTTECFTDCAVFPTSFQRLHGLRVLVIGVRAQLTAPVWRLHHSTGRRRRLSWRGIRGHGLSPALNRLAWRRPRADLARRNRPGPFKRRERLRNRQAGRPVEKLCLGVNARRNWGGIMPTLAFSGAFALGSRRCACY